MYAEVKLATPSTPPAFYVFGWMHSERDKLEERLGMVWSTPSRPWWNVH